MKIEYKLDQVYKSCEVDNIQDIPNYDKITYIDCSMNQLIYLPDLPSTLTTLYCSLNWLSSLPDLPSTLTSLYCYNNQFIKKDQYLEGIIDNIMRIVPWTKSKEYFLNNLIEGCAIKCSKCLEMIMLKEKYIYNLGCTIMTKICIRCL